MPEAGEWVTIARLGRTRGLKGEIYAAGNYDARRVEELKKVWLRSPGGEWLNGGQPLEVVSVVPYKGRLVLRFAGIESIGQAEPLERSELLVPAGDRPPLDEGEYYLADLPGCGVFDRRTGVKLGTVTGWQSYGGPELLEVVPEGSDSGKAVLIPFARSICVEIDPRGRRIAVDLPEGLLELNA